MPKAKTRFKQGKSRFTLKTLGSQCTMPCKGRPISVRSPKLPPLHCFITQGTTQKRENPQLKNMLLASIVRNSKCHKPTCSISSSSPIPPGAFLTIPGPALLATAVLCATMGLGAAITNAFTILKKLGPQISLYSLCISQPRCTSLRV